VKTLAGQVQIWSTGTPPTKKEKKKKRKIFIVDPCVIFAKSTIQLHEQPMTSIEHSLSTAVWCHSLLFENTAYVLVQSTTLEISVEMADVTLDKFHASPCGTKPWDQLTKETLWDFYCDLTQH